MALRRVDRASGSVSPDFRVSLTSQATARQLCGFGIPYDVSCFTVPQRRVVINVARWGRGAGAFDGDLWTYRQYAINHEVGHALGHDHQDCPAGGAPAPVMMQQTFGTANDYLAALTNADPQGMLIPRDGAVCVPNPWPHPQPDPAPAPPAS